MTITEILHEFEDARGYYPEEAVAAAVEQQAAITPHLLRLLQDTVAQPEATLARPGAVGYMFAAFLLAQFRETAAYPLVVAYARLPEETLEELGGEAFLADFHRVLASVYDGNSAPLKDLATDPKTHQYAHAVAINALTLLALYERVSRDEVVTVLNRLLTSKLYHGEDFALQTLVDCCVDLHPADMLPALRKLYASDQKIYLDTALEDVVAAAGRDRAKAMAEGKANIGGLIDAVAPSMADWVCFTPEGDEDFESPDWDENEADLEATPAPAADAYVPTTPGVTVKRQTPKVGPNEQCPCGSGKKFKKCCAK